MTVAAQTAQGRVGEVLSDADGDARRDGRQHPFGERTVA
jgi:hypothetical protein